MMAAISPACLKSVVGQSGRVSGLELPYRNKSVRGQSVSSLPERVSSGKCCSTSGVPVGYGKSRMPIAGKSGRSGYACVSDFVGSIKCATRCSGLPGDGSSAGTSKRFDTYASSMHLRWVEEYVELGSAESGSRNVSVVRAFPEDTEGILSRFPEQQAVFELLETDRPQPIPAAFASSNQFAMEMVATSVNAIGGNSSDAQVMAAPMFRPKLVWFAKSEAEENRLLDRAINATLAGAAIAYVLTKAVTVDHDYWHGWTMFEILKYAPLHNWHAYEEVLKSNPVFAKMMISGAVYSIGDWIGQCMEGKSILEFNRVRLLRSGLVGFCLHGSLSHYYYYVCEFLFPFKGWWVVPLKVVFDQTIWSAIWNSIYYITLGLLRLESPLRIWKDLQTTFFPLLTAGWKLWPFAHIVTYGLVPVEQRVLWVDCVEIVWVTILSMFANEQAEKRLEVEDGSAHTVLTHSSDKFERLTSSEKLQ